MFSMITQCHFIKYYKIKKVRICYCIMQVQLLSVVSTGLACLMASFRVFYLGILDSAGATEVRVSDGSGAIGFIGSSSGVGGDSGASSWSVGYDSASSGSYLGMILYYYAALRAYLAYSYLFLHSLSGMKPNRFITSCSFWKCFAMSFVMWKVCTCSWLNYGRLDIPLKDATFILSPPIKFILYMA